MEKFTKNVFRISTPLYGFRDPKIVFNGKFETFVPCPKIHKNVHPKPYNAQ